MTCTASPISSTSNNAPCGTSCCGNKPSLTLSELLRLILGKKGSCGASKAGDASSCGSDNMDTAEEEERKRKLLQNVLSMLACPNGNCAPTGSGNTGGPTR